MLTTEVAIGRKTKQGPLTAYGIVRPKWRVIGIIACVVPAIILPYYCAIGGWVIKYLTVYLTGHGSQAAADGYFTSFISETAQPIIFMLIFLILTAFVIIRGVQGGIEKYSKILMPILFVMIIGIALYALTLSYTDASGVTRTGLQGLKIYVIPDFTGMTIRQLFIVLMDAMGQLFFSISVAMGKVGPVIGLVFFLMVTFAAITSSITIMEAIVSSLIDTFHWTRKKSSMIVVLYAFVFAVIVCLGYNHLYFEAILPNGTVAQILDVLDYISNNCLMPLLAFFACILIAPVLLFLLFIQSVGILKL